MMILKMYRTHQKLLATIDRRGDSNLSMIASRKGYYFLLFLLDETFEDEEWEVSLGIWQISTVWAPAGTVAKDWTDDCLIEVDRWNDGTWGSAFFLLRLEGFLEDDVEIWWKRRVCDGGWGAVDSEVVIVAALERRIGKDRLETM